MVRIHQDMHRAERSEPRIGGDGFIALKAELAYPAAHADYMDDRRQNGTYGIRRG